jgi:hypothetical protein
MTTQASGGIVPSLTSKDLLATLALAEFDLEIDHPKETAGRSPDA